MWSYRTSTTRSGRSGVNTRLLAAFHRDLSEPRHSCAACDQSQGCPANVVTSGCSSANSRRRSASGNAPTMPTEASPPSAPYRPSSSEPIASGPLACSRYPATTQSTVRWCLVLNMTRLSGS